MDRPSSGKAVRTTVLTRPRRRRFSARRARPTPSMDPSHARARSAARDGGGDPSWPGGRRHRPRRFLLDIKKGAPTGMPGEHVDHATLPIAWTTPRGRAPSPEGSTRTIARRTRATPRVERPTDGRGRRHRPWRRSSSGSPRLARPGAASRAAETRAARARSAKPPNRQLGEPRQLDANLASRGQLGTAPRAPATDPCRHPGDVPATHLRLRAPALRPPSRPGWIALGPRAGRPGRPRQTRPRRGRLVGGRGRGLRIDRAAPWLRRGPVRRRGELAELDQLAFERPKQIRIRRLDLAEDVLELLADQLVRAR